MRLSAFGDPRQGDAAAPLADATELVSLGAPTLVVFGVRRGELAPERFAQLLLAACGAASREAVVYSLRRGDGPFMPDPVTRAETFLQAGASAYRGGRVSADASAIDEQLRAWASEDAGAVRVVLGADFAARCHASAVVALTAGLPALAFSPAARAVLPRVGLQLTEPRARVAQGLVARVTR